MKQNIFARVMTFCTGRPLWEQIVAAAVLAGVPLAISLVSCEDPLEISVECQAPKRMVPGESVELTYEIRSNNKINIGLGAGLYVNTGEDLSNGTGNVDSVLVQTSRTSMARRFIVPSDLSPGAHEVVAELWPANTIGEPGAETVAEDLCGYFDVRTFKTEDK